MWNGASAASAAAVQVSYAFRFVSHPTFFFQRVQRYCSPAALARAARLNVCTAYHSVGEEKKKNTYLVFSALPYSTMPGMCGQ